MKLRVPMPGGRAAAWVNAALRRHDPHAGWSLLARLAWIASAAVLVSLVFGGFAMYWAASIENDQMLESRLEQFGATMLAIVEDHVTDLAPQAGGALAPLKTRPTAALLYRYQVWSRNGTLILRSHEAPAAAPMTPLGRLGYSTSHIAGEEYRIFSLPSHDGGLVIQVAENVNEAWRQVGPMTVYYAGFLLIPFGLVLGATWFLLRRALHSINTLADSLKQRNPLEVTPLPLTSPPREIVPILNAMDTLFARMQRVLSIERSFTSLAAHEMRTPLAGLRAQAQLLSREDLAEEPMKTVVSLVRGVDRASHMLDQLLDLARVESVAASGQMHMERVRIADVHEEVLSDLATRISNKRLQIAAVFGAEALWCHPFALSVLLRNLLFNAVLYSPDGGRILLTAKPRAGEVVLTVEDSGQGIPAADRERAFERFNRLGRTQADGVGLGLSIVLRVVEMHGAKIQLTDSALGGLLVQVQFPQPAPSAAG